MEGIKFAVLGVSILFLTGLTVASDINNEDVVIETPDEIVKGEEAEFSISIDGNQSHENLSYSFEFDDKEVETDDSSYTLDVFTEFERVQGCVSYDGGVDCNSKEVSVQQPDDFLQIKVSPESPEPGKEVTLTAEVGGEVREDLEYDWYVSGLSDDTNNFESEENPGPEITVNTEGADARRPAEVSLGVKNNEDREVGRLEKEISWNLHNPDVDGYDVEYGDEYAEIVVSEERWREGVEVKLGESLNGWTEVRLDDEEIAGGGSTLRLEDVQESNYDAPEDLSVYSVVKLSGENIDGLSLEPVGEVERSWAENNDLLISRRQAHLSFYLVENGDWTPLPTRNEGSEAEEMVAVQGDDHTEGGENRYVLDGETRIALAGNPEGVLARRFAAGPDGKCEELSEDEPLPPGWEEIDTNCRIYDDVQRRREDLNELETELKKRADESEYTALPDNFSESIQSIEQLIDDRDLRQAGERMRLLEERVGSRTVSSRRGDRLVERNREQYEEITMERQQVPEEVRNYYNRSEKVDDLLEEYKSHMNNSEPTKAAKKLSEAQEIQHERMEKAQERARLDRRIEQLKNQDLNENQTRLVEKAEELREQGNYTEANMQLRPLREKLQRSMLRQMVRSIVIDVLNEVLPFDIGSESSTTDLGSEDSSSGISSSASQQQSEREIRQETDER